MVRTVAGKRSRSAARGLPANPAFNQYLTIAVLIIVGIVFGAILANQAGIVKKSSFSFFVQDMLSKDVASKGFVSLFLSSFFSSAVLICAAFFLGLCAFGQPGILLIPVFKGAGIGLSMSYVYIQYGIKGMGICLLFLLPQAVLSSLSIIVACREGIRFSNTLAKTIFHGSQQTLWPDFSNLCYKYVFCFVLVLAAAVIEAFSIMGFSRLFFS